MIYIIAPEGSNTVKIGYTAGEPARRVAGLQTGNPARLVLRWSGDGDQLLERHLHVVFNDYRVQGEWFDLSSFGDPVQAVKDEIHKAREFQSSGRTLLAGQPYRYPVLQSAQASHENGVTVVACDSDVPPELIRHGVFAPSGESFSSFDDRFPPSEPTPRG